MPGNYIGVWFCVVSYDDLGSYISLCVSSTDGIVLISYIPSIGIMRLRSDKRGAGPFTFGSTVGCSKVLFSDFDSSCFGESY